MNEKEILEGNKLIAEFDKSDAVNSPHLKEAHELKYHTSWDWLMPVIKKIQLMEVSQFDKKKPIMSALMDVEIESLHSAVVVFIEWHNTTKQ